MSLEQKKARVTELENMPIKFLLFFNEGALYKELEFLRNEVMA